MFIDYYKLNALYMINAYLSSYRSHQNSLGSLNYLYTCIEGTYRPIVVAYKALGEV